MNGEKCHVGQKAVFQENAVVLKIMKVVCQSWKLSPIIRLNFGIFMIFERSERNLNLNASDCRASKIIPNDTKLEPISWELTIKNPILNFCVGIRVSEHSSAYFL